MVLTLWMDEASQGMLERLRQEHFPPERNVVPAHLTLFHALPGSRLDEVEGTIAQVAATTEPLAFSSDGVLFLGRGSAIRIACHGLGPVHGRLRNAWADYLGAQDRQPLRPHVTIQNKVAPEAARTTAESLRALPPLNGTALGLVLWRYLGGPWEELGRYPFAGGIE